MPIDSIDSNFPLEILSPVAGVARVGTGNGGNRRNASQSDYQEQAGHGDSEERANSDAQDGIEEAATLTLSEASLEQEQAVAPCEVVVYDGIEDAPVSLINEMA
jgi:hypothetical protein